MASMDSQGRAFSFQLSDHFPKSTVLLDYPLSGRQKDRMKPFTFISLLLLGMLSIARSSSIRARDEDEDDCLTRHEAADIVARWTSIAVKINNTIVDQTVTNDFTFYSDSQDFLEGLPYGSAASPQTPSINGKQDLINQQDAAQAPGTIVIPQGFTIFQILHSCSTITFRWRFHAISSGTDPRSTNKAGDPIEYAGIDVLVLVPETKLITKAYSEWNNGELLYDLGERVCFQKGNASACA